MTTLTETLHRNGFIISDQGAYSYEKATVASGQDLVAGQLVCYSGRKLIAFAGASSEVVSGIITEDVDATGGDKVATFLARSAEVRLADLTYPAGTTTLVVNDLMALNGSIVCR